MAGNQALPEVNEDGRITIPSRYVAELFGLKRATSLGDLLELNKHKAPAGKGYYLEGVCAEYHARKSRSRPPADNQQYEDARMRKLIAEANKAEHDELTAELNLRALENSLVSRTDIEKELSEAMKVVYHKIMQIPQEISAVLVGLDELEIKRELTQAYDTAIRSLKDGGFIDEE